MAPRSAPPLRPRTGASGSDRAGELIDLDRSASPADDAPTTTISVAARGRGVRPLRPHETPAPDTPVVCPGRRRGADRAPLAGSKGEFDPHGALGNIQRNLRALSRHVGRGDTAQLGRMVEMLDYEVDRAVTVAVRTLRLDPDLPASWADIGEALGISRHAALRRYGGAGARRDGGQPGSWRVRGDREAGR